MRVRDVMKREPNVAFPGQSLKKVGMIMAQVDCGVLPVLGEEDHVIGIVTDRDLCLALALMNQKPSKVWVEDVMTAEVHTCSPEDSIGDALEVMRTHRVRRLPAVDADGHLRGLLSFDDVVLEARSADNEEFAGPFYDDIARTLKAVNSHQLPGPAVA